MHWLYHKQNDDAMVSIPAILLPYITAC
uniref:Uncharacterized protein n=1 Tax=Arundo donax TaxID=35708 RepID=A0A0A9G3D8_ARUDO